MTAVVPDPGTPSVSIGIYEPVADPLLAASGAARQKNGACLDPKFIAWLPIRMIKGVTRALCLM